MSVLDAVRRHYLQQWGEPSREAEFFTPDDHVEVYKWETSRTSQGVTMYATLGASAADLPGARRGHRVEYLVGLQPDEDDVADPLASLGLYARQQDVAIGHGHTVGGDWPLWTGTSMTKFLVLEPASEVVPALLLDEGVHVGFLQAIPIFESERMFKNDRGVDALLEAWQDARVRVWDPQRSEHLPA